MQPSDKGWHPYLAPNEFRDLFLPRPQACRPLCLQQRWPTT